MFDIELQTNSSASNVVSKKIKTLDTITGVLKKGCSLTDPVILIQTNGANLWRDSFNYFHISSFNVVTTIF